MIIFLGRVSQNGVVARKKKLSAMEFTVLGIAWKRGPCTTYALMKELASSTSTYYKNRAGTAYPLVDRLLRDGLLEQADETGTRGERLISVTESGIAELTRWLSAPIDFAEVAHTVDFVRLRVFYLGGVLPDSRRELIDGAIETLHTQLARCEVAIAKYDAIGDVFSELATRGVVAETQARVDWLISIRDRAIAAPHGKPTPR